jgi:prophage regulatory protein
MTNIKHGVTPGRVTSIQKTVKTPIALSISTQKATIHQSVFDALPNSAFIREAQLVQSPKRPDTTAPLPFSAPTLWRKVKAGTFPKPIKLSERVTAWRVGCVRDWMLAQANA